MSHGNAMICQPVTLSGYAEWPKVADAVIEARDSMARKTKPRLSRDPYWDVVQSLMQNILTIYEAYRDKKPVMLFDMQEHRIYVYPYLEFKNDLSERSQRLLQDQYEQAMADDKIVVFVRDNDAKKLVSYSV